VVGPRVGLDAVAKRIFPSPYRESNSSIYCVQNFTQFTAVNSIPMFCDAMVRYIVTVMRGFENSLSPSHSSSSSSSSSSSCHHVRPINGLFKSHHCIPPVVSLTVVQVFVFR
jgi:hypothetical protein